MPIQNFDILLWRFLSCDFRFMFMISGLTNNCVILHNQKSTRVFLSFLLVFNTCSVAKQNWNLTGLNLCRNMDWYPPTGICLVVAEGLMKDLTLILSTKNTKQNKTNKENKPKQKFMCYKRSGEGFIVKNICSAILPATTSLKMSIVKKTWWVLLPMCFRMSFKRKICCVLRPTSLWRKYSCVLLVHLRCTFINVFIK